jgi:hypothetical protein
MNEEKSGSRLAVYLIGGAVILALIVLLFATIRSHGSRFDEGLIVVGATRIMAGEVPYRDFFANYPPGQFYTLAVLFRIFGTNLMVERIYDRLVIIAIVMVTYSIELMLISHKRALIVRAISAAVLSSSSFFGYPVLSALLLIVLALKCLLKFITVKRRYWLFLTGVCVGVAALFRHDFDAMPDSLSPLRYLSMVSAIGLVIQVGLLRRSTGNCSFL